MWWTELPDRWRCEKCGAIFDGEDAQRDTVWNNDGDLAYWTDTELACPECGSYLLERTDAEESEDGDR